MDVRGVSRDGWFTPELGTGSLRQTVNILTLRISVPYSKVSKVSGFDVSKRCHFECEGLKDPSKYARLFRELSNLSVDVVAVQEIHFTCAADFQVLEDDYVVLSEFNSRCSVGVSLLIGRSLNADVNLVLADNGGRVVVTDVAVKSFKFQVVVFYAPSIVVERVLFFGG